MVQDTAIVAMTEHNKIIHGLSNRAILNDLDGPQTQISRSGHSLTLNICKNGCRYGHSYYGRRIGNRTHARFEMVPRYHFNDLE